MRIVLTGGGSGGHFYPLIAVAEAINQLSEESRLLRPELYYFGPEPYDARALYENGIQFRSCPAGKMRRYFSLQNFTDVFKTVGGIFRAVFLLFQLYPDVVFSKGGYASIPTLVAARLLRIPVVIHESDAIPGRATRYGARFARRIALGYQETATFFPGKNVARTGNPVRRELFTISRQGGVDFFKLDPATPTILILGGSQGALNLNDVILDALPKLVEHYQVIHQTGASHFVETDRTAKLLLRNNPRASRYHPYPFLNLLSLKMAAGAASLIVSRAGSGSIFEIAAWGQPSILIPIPENISHDQRRNAFTYARTGAAVVVDEQNLTPNLLVSEIKRILDDPTLTEGMQNAAKKFATPDAARTIAGGLLEIALEHEQ